MYECMLTLQYLKPSTATTSSLGLVRTPEQAALCTRKKEGEKKKRPAHLAGSLLPAPACARRGSGGGGGGGGGGAAAAAAAAGLPVFLP
ncbi:hypothetical protein CH63R_11076 [Colletotrichum higginsianum IMI 349063]|uniref:Uncharacterized protein n=1 Tax=Colletotrichum higginsianum (strain IMI 349063) TaxID=759273 RepID=A0A1B7XX73_COLHI|nr:hypothetical protein CH63R_11076 [Colletotrichum higginsianum IMI 349063]OBR04373.1 hypothetical protein CH63R_11076 [Colletotrichum higginsianum IMI 349063]